MKQKTVIEMMEERRRAKNHHAVELYKFNGCQERVKRKKHKAFVVCESERIKLKPTQKPIKNRRVERTVPYETYGE